MFKGSGKTWLYLVGIAIMFVILITIGINYFVPILYGEEDIDLGERFNSPPDFSIDTNRDYIAKITTNYGEFVIDLEEKNAPQNVNNFIYLSNLNYYNGTQFHRLIPGLLIQGGDRNTLDDDPENDGLGNPGYVIDDEINWNSLNLSEEQRSELEDDGYESKSGIESKPLTTLSVAMANGGPDTNGSQFFIIIAPNNDSRVTQLNGRFTVIGNVIDGKSTLDQIANIPVDNPNLRSPRPSQEIVLQDIEIFTR